MPQRGVKKGRIPRHEIKPLEGQMVLMRTVLAWSAKSVWALSTLLLTPAI